MAYGGGTFYTQNKKLPGAYINFVSAASSSVGLSERGVVAMPLELDWGPDDEIFEVTQEDFQKNTREIFGYNYSDEKMKGLRDLFRNAQKLYAYKLTSGGTKASCTFGTAVYSGMRGNDLMISIYEDVDDPSKFDVTIYLDKSKVDEQIVASASDLVDDAYVIFNKDAELAETAGMPFENGSNGDVEGDAYQEFLNKAEAYSFNIAAVVTDSEDIKSLFAAWVERLRDNNGVKFQVVLQDYAQADYMGVISVKNEVTDDGWDPSSLVYWVAGLEAGCAVNKSCQNTIYNGEFNVNADYTQTELENAIDNGELVLHRVGSTLRVLSDINSMVTVTEDCGEVFKDNQTIRVIDEIAMDIADLFVTKYLGLVPNDEAGRISLWSDIVKIHSDLQDMRAIEDFTDSDITVEQGNSKKSVVVTDSITVINAMSQLYMTVTVA